MLRAMGSWRRSMRRAVAAAQAIGQTLAPISAEVRAGLHTGEIELLGDDVAGLAVHIGARVASLAGPGEVLVSRAVEDLVAGWASSWNCVAFTFSRACPTNGRSAPLSDLVGVTTVTSHTRKRLLRWAASGDGGHRGEGNGMTATVDDVQDTTTDVDMAKVEAFGEKMTNILNFGMTANMMSIGHQVGLFDTMATISRSAPPDEIALNAGLDERYVREWLGVMATSGVVEYEPGAGGYRLPPEHAALTTRAAGPNNFATFTQFIPVCASIEPELVDAFRNGGGVPYSSFPRFHSVMREVSAQIFDATLVDGTLALVPGIADRLESGISVADVGTGSGHAVNVMAQAFPESTFAGFDISEEALAVGRAEAREWGLTNAEFHVHDAAHLDDVGTFDFVTTFDAVHDQVDPLAMVAGVFDILEPGGYWLCVDIQASSHVGENLDHPMGPFFYAVSCSHCMTVSLAHDGAGLGAMWGVQAAREMFTRAGFVDIEIHTIDGDVSNNYYICRKPTN